MQNDNVAFLQVLRIPHCELRQIKKNKSFLKAKGHLQVLYSDVMNLFILKLNDQHFLLDQNFEVTGCYSNKDKWNSYLWAGFDGFWLLKVDSNVPGAITTNFETVLENTTNFIRQGELAQQLAIYCHEEKHEGFLEKGFHATAEAFSKLMAPHGEDESHPNQVMIRSFEDLMNVDSPAVPVIDILTRDIQNMRDEVNEVTNNHQKNTYWTTLRGEERPLKKADDLLNVEPLKPSLYRQQSGAENIRTTKTVHAQDQQEYVGAENQRLPSYEVQHTKDTLLKGFRKASFNLADKEEIPEVEEDLTFTTGLCEGLCTGHSVETHTQAQSQSKNIIGHLDQKASGKGTQISRDTGTKLEKWGSNISNASETNPRASELEFSQPTTLVSDQNTRLTGQQQRGGPLASNPLASNLMGTGLPSETLGQANLG